MYPQLTVTHLHLRVPPVRVWPTRSLEFQKICIIRKVLNKIGTILITSSDQKAIKAAGTSLSNGKGGLIARLMKEMVRKYSQDLRQLNKPGSGSQQISFIFACPAFSSS